MHLLHVANTDHAKYNNNKSITEQVSIMHMKYYDSITVQQQQFSHQMVFFNRLEAEQITLLIFRMRNIGVCWLTLQQYNLWSTFSTLEYNKVNNNKSDQN